MKFKPLNKFKSQVPRKFDEKFKRHYRLQLYCDFFTENPCDF